jgi:Lon protease-like protein
VPRSEYNVALFPLPELVLFPATLLPLHIFEPRYRQMTADVLAGDGRILITQLKPGWERAGEEHPPAYEVGCVGRIVEHRQLEDGRYHLILVGEERVRIQSLSNPLDKLYRRARVAPLLELDPSDPSAAAELAVQLRRVLKIWGREQREPSFYAQFVTPTLGFAALVNLAALILPFDAAERQRLLEQDELAARGRRVLELARPLLSRVLFLRPFRDLQPEDPRVN